MRESSGERPLLDTERTSPCSSHMDVRPGHRWRRPPSLRARGWSPSASRARAPDSDEFASPAFGDVDIDRPRGMPSRRSVIGEGQAFPALAPNSAMPVIHGSSAASASKPWVPSPFRRALSGASEASPSHEPHPSLLLRPAATGPPPS